MRPRRSAETPPVQSRRGGKGRVRDVAHARSLKKAGRNKRSLIGTQGTDYRLYEPCALLRNSKTKGTGRTKNGMPDRGDIGRAYRKGMPWSFLVIMIIIIINNFIEKGRGSVRETK